MKKITADAIRTNMQITVFNGLLFCIISLVLALFFASNGLKISDEAPAPKDIYLVLVFFFAGVVCLICRGICWTILHYSKIKK
ncbi:MAG: hypothetical protein ABIE36_01720 [Candidatus Diapherotrites archaeon]